jgi:long-chain fatty acid transport protein
MRMKRFEKYQDLFAQRGDFDIPENYNVGIAFQASPKLTIAADYQRINVGDVRAPGNPSTNAGNAVAATGFTTGSLGCDNCRGFGWSNLNVFKLGVEYQYSQPLTLRAGLNITDNPIGGRDVTFNIIAPGVVKNHLTAGFTYDIGGGSEITMAYMHAFRNSVTGQTLYANFIAGATATEKIQMSQNSLGIAYGLKFK